MNLSIKNRNWTAFDRFIKIAGLLVLIVGNCWGLAYAMGGRDSTDRAQRTELKQQIQQANSQSKRLTQQVTATLKDHEKRLRAVEKFDATLARIEANQINLQKQLDTLVTEVRRQRR